MAFPFQVPMQSGITNCCGTIAVGGGFLPVVDELWGKVADTERLPDGPVPLEDGNVVRLLLEEGCWLVD